MHQPQQSQGCIVTEVETLAFQHSKNTLINEQKAILQYYSHADQPHSRKLKADLFTNENMKALLAVFQLDSGKIVFGNKEALGAQFQLFMQNIECLHLKTGDQLDIREEEMVVILKGSIGKKIVNLLPVAKEFVCEIVSTCCRKSRRFMHKSKKRHSKSQSCQIISSPAKNYTKKIQITDDSPPCLLKYEYSDRNPYECLSNTIAFKVSHSSLNKLQAFLAFSQKEELIKFMSTALGVQKNRRFTKIIPQLTIEILHIKHSFKLRQNRIYMIFAGQILLNPHSKEQLQLREFGIVEQNSQKKQSALVKQNNTIVISVDTKILYDCFKEFEPETLSQIQEKLAFVSDSRKALFKDAKVCKEKPLLYSPLIQSESFQLKMIHKERSQRINGIESAYFRMPSKKESDKENLVVLEPECSKFMGNYPYRKLVESYDRIRQKKYYYQLENYHRKKAREARIQQKFRKSKGEKQYKHLYYMNKVRKLKIKNMAEKAIPNGHRKLFDTVGAEKTLNDCSLFSSFIQFPVKLLSEECTADKRENMSKDVKDCDLRKKSKGKVLQRGEIRRGSKKSLYERKTISFTQKTKATFSTFPFSTNEKSFMSVSKINKPKSAARMTTEETDDFNFMKFKNGENERKGVSFSSEVQDKENKGQRKRNLSKFMEKVTQELSPRQEQSSKAIEEASNKIPKRRPLTSFTHNRGDFIE